MLKFGTKYVLFWYFWERTLKQLLSDMKSAPSSLSICQILQQKKKSLNFGPKMPDLCIFTLEFENSFAIFNISTLEFF